MEYCRNGELFQFIELQGAIEESKIRVLFYQIVQAVNYIHKNHIVHRDIKPENILLDDNYNLKLADFGFCHYYSPESTKHQFLKTPCGSLFYSPPEILASIPYDGIKSDMWSLGIVLFAMVNGTLPWSNIDSQFALCKAILNMPIYISPDISPPIQQILSMLLEKEPEDRPTTDQLLKMPWLAEATKENDIQTTSLQSTHTKTKTVRSADDALNVFRSRQTFADHSHRVIIIKPDVSKKASTTRHSGNTAVKFPYLDVIRKVPSRTIKKH